MSAPITYGGHNNVTRVRSTVLYVVDCQEPRVNIRIWEGAFISGSVHDEHYLFIHQTWFAFNDSTFLILHYR